jgi:hypothetical protein
LNFLGNREYFYKQVLFIPAILSLKAFLSLKNNSLFIGERSLLQPTNRNTSFPSFV